MSESLASEECAIGQQPYRFVSDLVIVIDDPAYPGITWNAEGTQFRIDRHLFATDGGGMSLLCKSKIFGSFVRQLNNFSIYLDSKTHHYAREYLTRGASPEQLALISRKLTGPAAKSAAGSGKRRQRRVAHSRVAGDDSDSHVDDYDEEYAPWVGRRPRGGGVRSPAHGNPQTARSSGSVEDAAGTAAVAHGNAGPTTDISIMQAQTAALAADLAATRRAHTATQATLQLVSRLVHRLGYRVGYGFVQLAPGPEGTGGLDMHALKDGEVCPALSEEEFIAAVARIGSATSTTVTSMPVPVVAPSQTHFAAAHPAALTTVGAFSHNAARQLLREDQGSDSDDDDASDRMSHEPVAVQQKRDQDLVQQQLALQQLALQQPQPQQLHLHQFMQPSYFVADGLISLSRSYIGMGPQASV